MRVQVRVLLLPPRTGVPATDLHRWVEGALGIWKAHPVRSGTYLRGLRVRLASLPPVCELERTANGEAIRPEPGGSREG